MPDQKPNFIERILHAPVPVTVEPKEPKYVVRTETFEFIDYMGRPVFTDGAGLRVVPFEELWNRPYSQKMIDALAEMGLVRAIGTNEYYSDGTYECISDNIGEYHADQTS